MYSIIVELIAILTVVGIVTAVVWSIVAVIYVTITEESAINATLFLTGLFGSIFFVIAPFIFNPRLHFGLLLVVLYYIMN